MIDQQGTASPSTETTESTDSQELADTTDSTEQFEAPQATETAPRETSEAVDDGHGATDEVAAPVEPDPEAPLADLDRAAEPIPPTTTTAEASTESSAAASVEDSPEAPPAPPAEETPAVPRTVGRLVADALRAAGVRYAFTVPGESFLGLLEGLDGAGIRVVATRHEGAASFMAEAYGQLTGRPAACLATRAVGAANLAIGIHTARQNSTPMFALVGQVERQFRGREAFQEVDQVDTFGRVAKWAAEPREPAAVVTAVGEAIRHALGGRPGPVLLSLPEDLLDEMVPAGLDVDTSRPSPPRADVPEVRAVLQLLASAERPVILAGAGVLRARTSSDLTRFAEMLEVPVVAAWRRGDVVSNEHPLFLGMAGYGSPAAVRERLERADAMLVIGCRLSEVTSFGYRVPAEGTRWAHVDLAPRDGRDGLVGPAIAVRSDARAFLRAAVQRLRASALLAAPLDARRVENERDRAAWEQAANVEGGEWSGPGVHPGKVITALRQSLPDEAILTTDAGNFGGWAARGFRFRRPGTFLGPTSGAMGYGLPAAIAAALVHRDRPVVALVGDGGLAMSMAELETAVREHTRVVVLAFDNERYGTIRMHQEARSGGTVGTDLGPIDFAGVARACGARGVRVDTDDAFEPALRQALTADKPTVIQLVLDRRWVSVDQPAVG
ncbi:MAG TPA: thiamine pyrophosphate-dependent enzyme [Candidatus Limnocylindrales bacterium]